MHKNIIFTDFGVKVDERLVIKPFSLMIKSGATAIITGANGSGKSSLLYGIFGHPHYHTFGSCTIDSINLLALSPDKRVRHRLFLAPQYSVALNGVRVFDFIREMVRAMRGAAASVDEVYDELCAHLAFLGLNESFAQRFLHEGFSGGEKKRFELLQMLMMEPTWVFLDEIDSGLDVQGRFLIREALIQLRRKVPNATVVAVTHYAETVTLLNPDLRINIEDGIVRVT